MKSFGPKPWVLPQPVLIIGTYNEDGTPNAMNAAWGGQWDAKEIMICMGTHATWRMLVILVLSGLFDRFFIDWYWVGKTKAWIVPGTEDLQPYIPKNVIIRKWFGTLVAYSVIAAAMAGVVTLFL